MKKIKLSNGMVAIVDDEDYEKVRSFHWYAHQSGGTYYARRYSHRIAGKEFYIEMHRLILGLSPGDGKYTDHIDGNGLNNQQMNLRVCTQQQNTFNQKVKRGTSKFKGVCWHKRDKKWHAQIQHKKNIYLGYFESEIEAAKTYDDKARELFGEFAWLNFP